MKLIEELRKTADLAHAVTGCSLRNHPCTLAANEIEQLRAALELYVNAGFGESTDFYKQGAAYYAAVEALK